MPAGIGAGTYYLIAKADADNGVGETQEGNNTALTIIQVGPDLVLVVFTAPFTAGAGATISVSDTTRNQGGGVAGAAPRHPPDSISRPTPCSIPATCSWGAGRWPRWRQGPRTAGPPC